MSRKSRKTPLTPPHSLADILLRLSWVNEGQIIAAGGRSYDGLGKRLVEKGALTPEQLERATAALARMGSADCVVGAELELLSEAVTDAKRNAQALSDVIQERKRRRRERGERTDSFITPLRVVRA